MNLLVGKNNYETYTHNYSSNAYDIKFFTYLKKQYPNINLNHISINVTDDNYTFFTYDLNVDFYGSTKDFYLKSEKCEEIDNKYVIKDNFLEHNKINNERFHMFILSIVDEKEEYSHANVLIHDSINNIVYRFEPNGEDFYPELSDYLTKYFSQFGVKFSLLKGFYSNNKIYGPQSYADNVEWSKNEGTCMYWSYMFCNLIQENYNNYYLEDETTLEHFTQDFYYQLYKHKFSYSGFINNFIEIMKNINIEDLVDPSNDKDDINWERICLIKDLSEEYIKKILKDYWYCWETICKYQDLTDEFKQENDVYAW